MPAVRALSLLYVLVSAARVEARDADETSADKQSSEQLPDPKPFMEVVRDMRGRWRAHKQAQMAALEPWKVKSYEEKKMRHRAERAQLERHSHRENAAAAGVAAAASKDETADGQSQEEKKAAENQRKAEKFGEQCTFTIQQLTGEQFKVMFRKKTHMRVLMGSIFQRMLLTPEEAATVRFMYGDKEITSYDTAEDLGMQDHDTIVLKGDLMEQRAQAQRFTAKRERAKGQLAAKADSAKNQHRLAVARKNIEKQHRLQAVQDEEALRRHFRANNMIHVNFDDGHGKAVRLGFQRTKWLGPLFEIACKRLGIPPEATHFKANVNGTMTIIKPTDTIVDLHLTEDSVIAVKENKRYSTAAPMAGPIV